MLYLDQRAPCERPLCIDMVLELGLGLVTRELEEGGGGIRGGEFISSGLVVL